LARAALRLPRLGVPERRVERGDELGAVPAERIAGAGVDERFQDTLVTEAQIDPVAQVHQRAVWAAGAAPREDRLDGAGSHVLDRPEAEPDAAVADHGELEPGLVHVRR